MTVTESESGERGAGVGVADGVALVEVSSSSVEGEQVRFRGVIALRESSEFVDVDEGVEDLVDLGGAHAAAPWRSSHSQSSSWVQNILHLTQS